MASFLSAPKKYLSKKNSKKTKVKLSVIYTWGSNVFGELGIGSSASSSVPVEVKDLNGIEISNIEASKYNTAFVTKNGEIYTQGRSVE